ncbi:protein toll-like [Linepithema humile]|uniref:protein toll-like n=1 Tax=Linepithema humile TaxID=83485 RepID=UPI00351E848E
MTKFDPLILGHHTEDLLFSSNDIIVNLTHNKIRHIFLHNAKNITKVESKTNRTVKILVENNPLNCDCDVYHFLCYNESEMHNIQSYFQMELDNLICHRPKKLEKVRIKNLTSDSKQYLNKFTCKIENTDSIIVYSERCDCFMKPEDKAFIYDCSYKNLTNVPHDIKESNISLIQNLTKLIDTILHLHLKFSHNWLTQMPDLKKLELKSVNELSLSHNIISYISLSELLTTLKICNATVFYPQNNLYKKSLCKL